MLNYFCCISMTCFCCNCFIKFLFNNEIFQIYCLCFLFWIKTMRCILLFSFCSLKVTFFSFFYAFAFFLFLAKWINNSKGNLRILQYNLFMFFLLLLKYYSWILYYVRIAFFFFNVFLFPVVKLLD